MWQSPIPSSLGCRYYVIFIDDFTRFSWIYPLRAKSEVYSKFCVFQQLVENLFDAKIKMFQSDGGREFDNSMFHKHFDTWDLFPQVVSWNSAAKWGGQTETSPCH